MAIITSMDKPARVPIVAGPRDGALLKTEAAIDALVDSATKRLGK
jgi:hypothetical protein